MHTERRNSRIIYIYRTKLLSSLRQTHSVRQTCFAGRQDRRKKLKPWLDIHKFWMFRIQRQEGNLKVKFYGNSWFLRSIKFENCYKTESVSRDSNHAVCPFRDHLLHLRAMCSSTICSHSSPNSPPLFLDLRCSDGQQISPITLLLKPLPFLFRGLFTWPSRLPNRKTDVSVYMSANPPCVLS